VLIPPRKTGESSRIYSSNDVTVAKELEVPRSLLTGITQDALDTENTLIRRIFDLSGKQQLKSMVQDEVESSPAAPSPDPSSRKMTAGTGVTGQMRKVLKQRVVTTSTAHSEMIALSIVRWG
jgi:hypothetical protein